MTLTTVLRNAARRLLGALRLRPRPRLSLEPVDPPRVGGRLLLRLRIEPAVEVTVRDARVVFRRHRWSDAGGDAQPRIERTTLGSETFTSIGRLQAGQAHDELSWFAIPADAPPSGRAGRTRVVYRVSVRLRFADAPTLRRRVAVTVLPA